MTKLNANITDDDQTCINNIVDILNAPTPTEKEWKDFLAGVEPLFVFNEEHVFAFMYDNKNDEFLSACLFLYEIEGVGIAHSITEGLKLAQGEIEVKLEEIEMQWSKCFPRAKQSTTSHVLAFDQIASLDQLYEISKIVH